MSDLENKNIINGWEYLTDINPINLPKEQHLQNNYLQEYNMAFHKFLKELCFDLNTLKQLILDNEPYNITKYKFVIDTSDECNIINQKDEYPIKFLKTKFLLFKMNKIKNALIDYYKPLGFYIKGPNELINNKKISKYFIELYWQKENNLTKTATEELIN